ncbi:MAG: hypothetical protein Q8922_13845 [Bacteroidota bacterium]|nr:hypothetical protein [Bacteroidota bacterium]MDP4232360.1 hypothetical protein [Bacteroidota bacterium]MDP4241497.1 hypothetical protein [Bacteroidota bacterium]MDP4289005.1 hypothetical protein [Bacteroidota bacterium]
MTIVLFALLQFAIPQQITPADTSLGRLVKTITTDAEFVSFDKDHVDRAFIRDESHGGIAMNVLLAPEMDCFLANHAKDQLRITFEIRERENAGKTEKLNVALRIVSLKTGDDTKTWAEKESQDSTLLGLHHEQLVKVRAGRE